MSLMGAAAAGAACPARAFLFLRKIHCHIWSGPIVVALGEQDNQNSRLPQRAAAKPYAQIQSPALTDFAQSVKQQADIVKVIEGYIRLRKAGAVNYTGLCPFHKEKSPSFSVHAVRQFYHCFGCGVSGDVFSFVGKIENVSFPEAVKIVAVKCGIPLPKKEYSSPEEAASARQRRTLLDLHEAAAAWFEEQLRGPEGAVAREYLTGRRDVARQRPLQPEGTRRRHHGRHLRPLPQARHVPHLQ
jgi:hypothetical protein